MLVCEAGSTGCRSDCVPAPSAVSPPDTAPWERRANMLARAQDHSDGRKSAPFREYSSVGGGARDYHIISVLSNQPSH